MPEQISTELVISKPGQLQRPSTSFAPTTFHEAMEFCKQVADSDLVPKDYRGKPGNIFVAIQTGAELGIAPMQALSGISVINGRGAVWGDLLLAIIQGSPAYEWHKEWFEGEGKTRVAICQMKRKGSEVHTTRFGYEDAARAGLIGRDTYKNYPDRMFQMRARGFCGRDKFADVLKGVITAEEAMDTPITGDVGSVEVDLPKPDPNEEPITREEATALWQACKANGHNADTYKHGLVSIAGVERSDQVKRKFHEALKKYCSTPPSAAPAATTAAPAASEQSAPTGEEEIGREAGGALWTLAKSNGYDVANYKAGLLLIAKVERSDIAKKKYHDALVKHFSAPFNPDSEPPEAEQGQP